METNFWCLFVLVFVNGVMSTQMNQIMKGEPEVTLKILRPMKEVDFKSITVTRTFDIRTLSLTYIAHMIGPEDTEGEFNGSLKRVKDVGNYKVLQAKLIIPALERRGENYPVIVLSSKSSSSTYIMGINTLSTTYKQRVIPGERCLYRISSAGNAGAISYNTKVTCYRKTQRVFTYFKAGFEKTEKGLTFLFDEEDEDIKSKGYLHSTSSEEGKVASCYLDYARMLADGVKLASLRYELLVVSEDEDELVAFSVWSYDII